MRKIDFAISLLGRLRTENNPPLTRYAVCLVLLGKPHLGTTAIGRKLGSAMMVSSSLDTCRRAGLIVARKDDKGRNLWSLTAKGKTIAHDLLTAGQEVSA